MSPRKASDDSHLKGILGHANLRSDVAVYAQLVNNVQFAIASGKIKAGEKLPAIRQLGEWLNLNANTVSKAYRDLEVMGLVSSRRGMGVFVKKGIQRACSERCRLKVIGRLHEVISEAKAAGMAPAEVKDAAKKCCASSTAPYEETPKEILALAKRKGK